MVSRESGLKKEGSFSQGHYITLHHMSSIHTKRAKYIHIAIITTHICTKHVIEL